MLATTNPTILTAGIMCGLVCLLLIASYFDWQQRRIPNLLTLGGSCCGVLLHAFIAGLDGVLFALAGLTVGFFCLFPGYALGKSGAGDVKLLAASGSFLGPLSALVAGVACILAGAVSALAVACLARGNSPWARYTSMFHSLRITGQWLYMPPLEGESMARGFAFAPAIALGSAIGAYHYLAQAV